MNLTQDKLIALAKEAGIDFYKCQYLDGEENLRRLTKFAELLTNSDAEPIGHLKFESAERFDFQCNVKDIDKLREQAGLNVKTPVYLRAPHSKAEQDADCNVIKYLQEANRFGQFADDFHQPLTLSIRKAIRDLINSWPVTKG